MVEFVKGKALYGALTILIGGLLEIALSVEQFLDPEIWAQSVTLGPLVIMTAVIPSVHGIIAVIGGLLVVMGNNTGNTLAVVLALVLAILGIFYPPPPASITLGAFYYAKGGWGPTLYLVGGLFGLSIKEE